MVFKNNIPQPTDNLLDSQGDLLNNNAQLDTSFGIDHYTFSNLTTNNGKHNQVTTPLIIGGAHPATAAAEPKMYAMQDSANIGVINYSRGPSNAVPSPITCLHGGPTPVSLNTVVNILDFTGITLSLGTVYAGFNSILGTAVGITFYWDGTNFFFPQQPITGTYTFSLILTSTGNVLQIKRTVLGGPDNLYWTLQLHRLQ